MTELDPIQATPLYAEKAFSFLTQSGFHIHERWTSGGRSSRDGWRLTYMSPSVQVAIVYLDMQLEIEFRRSDDSVDYWAIDRDIFGRRSGFHGNMFPPEKLASAIDRVSADIRLNHGHLLAGDETSWSRVLKELQSSRLKNPRQ